MKRYSQTLLVIINIFLLISVSAHQVVEYESVVVAGYLEKPGRYKLIKKRESIAQLLTRVGGVQVSAESFKKYASGSIVSDVYIKFYRDKKTVILKLGRDDDFMRKTTINSGDVFSILRRSKDSDVKYDHILFIKSKK